MPFHLEWEADSYHSIATHSFLRTYRAAETTHVMNSFRCCRPGSEHPGCDWSLSCSSYLGCLARPTSSFFQPRSTLGRLLKPNNFLLFQNAFLYSVCLNNYIYIPLKFLLSAGVFSVCLWICRLTHFISGKLVVLSSIYLSCGLSN